MEHREPPRIVAGRGPAATAPVEPRRRRPAFARFVAAPAERRLALAGSALAVAGGGRSAWSRSAGRLARRPSRSVAGSHGQPAVPARRSATIDARPAAARLVSAGARRRSSNASGPRPSASRAVLGPRPRPEASSTPDFQPYPLGRRRSSASSGIRRTGSSSGSTTASPWPWRPCRDGRARSSLDEDGGDPARRGHRPRRGRAALDPRLDRARSRRPSPGPGRVLEVDAGEPGLGQADRACPGGGPAGRLPRSDARPRAEAVPPALRVRRHPRLTSGRTASSSRIAEQTMILWGERPGRRAARRADGRGEVGRCSSTGSSSTGPKPGDPSYLDFTGRSSRRDRVSQASRPAAGRPAD